MIRKIYSTAGDRLFAIWGRKLYEIDTFYQFTLRGYLDTSYGVVGIAENETELCLVDGSEGYIYDLTTNTLTKISVSGFVGGTHVVNVNGFFVVPRIGTGQFANSDFQDGTTWNADWFYAAESIPDPIQALAKLNGQLWVFGTKSTEVWYVSGSVDDPADIFSRSQQGVFEVGTSARYSVATNGNSLFWLGSNFGGQGIVWMATGYQPVRISTHAIENTISRLSYTDDARGFCYSQEGHSFFVLNFVRGNKTLVYDVSTGLWHERAKWNSDDALFAYWDVIDTAFFNGKIMAASARDPKIYELDLDYYTDNGDEIRRERTGGHIHQDRKRLFFKRFEIDCERGVGLNDGQGEDPTAMLQMSDDGGMTWSNERYSSPGRIGKYKTIMDWNRLGSSRDRVFKLAVSDPVKWIITGATIDVEAGD
jgi:hypothetical protein